MVDRQHLKAEIMRAGMLQRDVAKALKMTEQTFSRKLKSGDFSIDDAKLMIELLQIREPASVFFADRVTH